LAVEAPGRLHAPVIWYFGIGRELQPGFSNVKETILGRRWPAGCHSCELASPDGTTEMSRGRARDSGCSPRNVASKKPCAPDGAPELLSECDGSTAPARAEPHLWVSCPGVVTPGYHPAPLWGSSKRTSSGIPFMCFVWSLPLHSTVSAIRNGADSVMAET
jgi:hypothetical protein